MRVYDTGREVREETGEMPTLSNMWKRASIHLLFPEDTVEKQVHWYLMMQTVIIVNRSAKNILWIPDTTTSAVSQCPPEIPRNDETF